MPSKNLESRRKMLCGRSAGKEVWGSDTETGKKLQTLQASPGRGDVNLVERVKRETTGSEGPSSHGAS